MAGDALFYSWHVLFWHDRRRLPQCFTVNVAPKPKSAKMSGAVNDLNEVVDLVENDGDDENYRKGFDPSPAGNTSQHAPKKRSRNETPTTHQRFCAPIRLFATDLDINARKENAEDMNHWSRTQCWTLREMIGVDHDPTDSSKHKPSIEWLVVGNYIIDFEFLLNEIPELLSVRRVVAFFGSAETSSQPWKDASLDDCIVDTILLDPSQPPGASNPTATAIPYGVHHSKFFLVGYADQSLRIIIHTANIRYDDIHCKAQAAFFQDFGLKSPENFTNVANTCEFEEDLIDYLDSYRYTRLHKWTKSGSKTKSLGQFVREYDFSSAKAVLVPSTPGYHRLDEKHRRGHWKMRQTIPSHTEAPEEETICDPIVCQFSSIGSLTERYLLELQTSMDMKQSRDRGRPGRLELSLKLVYPTVEEIRTSVEGYRGGGSVPGTMRNVGKPFLKRLFCRWSALSSSDMNPLWKGRNVPHMKTYFQTNSTTETLHWFVLTSHNLSKAAWGEIQTSSRYGGRRLFVRHWELGVFLSPQLLGASELLPWSSSERKRYSTESKICTIPIPYDLYPKVYGQGDRPWAVDDERGEQI